MQALIIDDDPMLQQLLSRLLLKQGVEQVRVASGGSEGIQLVSELEPDVLFLDIQMPDIDGLQVLEQLRQSHPELYIVIITGHVDVDAVEQIIRLGANHYLVKPIEENRLLKALSGCTKLSKLKGQ